MRLSFFLVSCGFILLFSCQNTAPEDKPLASKPIITYKSELPKTTKDYWYNGTAEVSSYALSQARYGEQREGTAVLVYVTEPFSKESNTKADQNSDANVSVLKLNATKKFNTGIYPYSMMTSSFYPIDVGDHSLKISSSSQEWCGHTYMELTNRAAFDIAIDSYFEGESNQLTLDKSFLEDDVWSIIRLRPDQLPMGEFEMIPSFFYLRLKHKKTKAYKATASFESKDASIEYSIAYPELERTLSIEFSSDFPYQILGWTESYSSGFGSNAKTMTTTAQKIKTLNTPYWQQNSNQYLALRDSLGLK
ncbi:MAG: septum formation inhibitor Maf [Gilvibacter sp.]